MTIKFDSFMGLVPKVDPALLPVNAAQIATNCKLWSGAIDPYRAPLVKFAPTKSGTMLSMYRMDDREGGADVWLTWPFDMDAVRGIVVDAHQRLYYTGEYEPRVTTYEMAASGSDTIDGADNYPSGFGNSGTDYPLAFYALGAPNPLTAPVVSVSGGAAADVTRAYHYTLVNAWGEESGPSPATTLAGKPDGTWSLLQMDAAPTNSGDIIGATAVGDLITAYTENMNWCRQGHRLTLASVTGMTDLNGSWTLAGALNVSFTTVSREITSNVATVVLTSTEGLETGQVVTMAGLGGSAAYLGTKTLTAVSGNSISYAATAADEGTTADTGGSCKMSYIQVTQTTAQTYTSGGTWTREAPWNVAGATKRIYRTLTGTVATSFQRVDEIAVANTTYVDTVADADLGPVITTIGFDTPDGTMTAVTFMANGMLAGAVSNSVAFCEAYKPYAWPIEYQQPVNWPVVGLGAFGQSLAVMTTGMHYIMSGVSPDSVSAIQGKTPYPCRSKRGIQSGAFGVLFPSDLGQILISDNGVEVLTAGYYSRDEWQAGVNAGVFSASMIYDNRYYGFWSASDGTKHGITIDPATGAAVITQSSVTVGGAWTDPETGKPYIIDSAGKVAAWDADPTYRLPSQWKSKLFNLSRPQSFGAVRIEATFKLSADEQTAIAAENVARVAANAILIAALPSGVYYRDTLNGSMGSDASGKRAMARPSIADLLSTTPDYVQFDVIADGVTKFSKTLTAAGTYRLPGGYRGGNYEFNVVTNVRVWSIVVANTPHEIALA